MAINMQIEFYGIDKAATATTTATAAVAYNSQPTYSVAMLLLKNGGMVFMSTYNFHFFFLSLNNVLFLVNALFGMPVVIVWFGLAWFGFSTMSLIVYRDKREGTVYYVTTRRSSEFQLYHHTF